MSRANCPGRYTWRRSGLPTRLWFWLASRRRELDRFDPLHRLETPVLVERTRGRIVSVQVPEEPLKLGDFLVANVVPNLEYRAVGPEITFAPPVATQTPTNTSRSGHPDVYNLIPRPTSGSRRHMAIQDVDASQPRRQKVDVGNGDVLAAAANQPKRAFWQGASVPVDVSCMAPCKNDVAIREAQLGHGHNRPKLRSLSHVHSARSMVRRSTAHCRARVRARSVTRE